MRSGNLKHKIEIQSLTETSNDFGETVEVFSTFKIIKASITPIAGKEYFSSKQVNAQVTHKIECRYVPSVLPTMQIVFGTRVFSIESITNIREANKTLQIMATEVV